MLRSIAQSGTLIVIDEEKDKCWRCDIPCLVKRLKLRGTADDIVASEFAQLVLLCHIKVAEYLLLPESYTTEALLNNLNILGDTITEVIKNFISFAPALSDILKAALQTGVSLMWSLLKTKGMLPKFQALIEQCRDTVRSKITLYGLVQKLATLNFEFVKSFTKLVYSRQDDKDENNFEIDVGLDPLSFVF